MTNVLLVAPWAPPCLAFARSLRRQGIRVHLVETSGRSARSLSALDGAETMPPDLVGTAAGIAFIKGAADRLGAAALVGLIDQHLLWIAAHRDLFEPSCRVLVPEAASLARIHSKCRQLDVARQVGLSILPSYLLTRPEDAAGIPVSDYPLAVRPDHSDPAGPGFKVRIARSHEQLQALVADGAGPRGILIAQPFRHLPNLVVHGVRSVAGEVIASRCYLVPRKFQGVSLAIEPCPFPEHLDGQCREFAALAEITGCYHFEFLFSAVERRAHFLEINVRMGGTTDKVRRTGFDEPLLLLHAYGIAPPPRPTPPPWPRRVVNKRVVLKHIVSAVKGQLTELDYPHTNRFVHVARSCRDLVAAKDSVFEWRDVPGSLRFHLR